MQMRFLLQKILAGGGIAEYYTFLAIGGYAKSLILSDLYFYKEEKAFNILDWIKKPLSI